MSGVRYNPKLRRRLLAGEEPEWLKRHPRRSYIVAATLARVPWADQKAIARIYRDAKARGLVVDHIEPLCHPDVCGLTVPNNLQAIGYQPNAAKGNKRAGWFDWRVEPHQMGLHL